MLNSYLAATQALLQNPAAQTPLYDPAALTADINTARGQLAIESDLIRFFGTIATVIGQRNYSFSAVSTGTSATNGIQGVVKVNRILYAVGSGYKWIRPRSWPWFDLSNSTTLFHRAAPPKCGRNTNKAWPATSGSIRFPILFTRCNSIVCAIRLPSPAMQRLRPSHTHGRTQCRISAHTWRY